MCHCVLCRILFWLNSLLNSWLFFIETLFVIVQHLCGCSVCHCSKWKRQHHITKLALIMNKKLLLAKITKLYFILFGKNWKTPLMSSVWSTYTFLCCDLSCFLLECVHLSGWRSFIFLSSVWLHFRFHEHWRFVLQRLAFLSAFVVYLESENLVTREEVAQILGSRYQFVCCVTTSW